MNKGFEMNLQMFAAEDNVITSAMMAKAREVDFVMKFSHDSLAKLTEALGVTRRVPMMEGTVLYTYKTTGQLEDGIVEEGDVIPLSKYRRERIPMAEINLQKWRKAVTAEAIKQSGYNEAVRMTDQKMIQDIQRDIRASFFGFLTDMAQYATPVTGDSLQMVLARNWGQLQVLFEDDSIESVHFVHPLTIADYLATTPVTTQTAFGMSYIENFLGLGTVIVTSQIPQGTVFSTAKDNLIMYYLTMDGELAQAFDLTTDESGFIGIHTSQTDDRAQIETLLMCGIVFLVEYLQGVVVGTVSGSASGGLVPSGGQAVVGG